MRQIFIDIAKSVYKALIAMKTIFDLIKSYLTSIGILRNLLCINMEKCLAVEA